MPESGNLLVIHSGWVHSQADDANRVLGGKLGTRFKDELVQMPVIVSYAES